MSSTMKDRLLSGPGLVLLSGLVAFVLYAIKQLYFLAAAAYQLFLTLT